MRGSWDGERDPLAALAAGDAALFEEFVRAEVGTFVGFFRRLGAGHHEAHDLAQEVFLKLFQHSRRYRPSERFPAFAFRVARNAWIDRGRRRAARGGGRVHAAGTVGEVEGLAPPRDEDEPDDELAGRARRLVRALGELSEAHRSVFELAVLQELGYQEVSALLGIPVGTVKSRMFHAVRRLRAALEGDGAQGEPA